MCKMCQNHHVALENRLTVVNAKSRQSYLKMVKELCSIFPILRHHTSDSPAVLKTAVQVPGTQPRFHPDRAADLLKKPVPFNIGLGRQKNGYKVLRWVTTKLDSVRAVREPRLRALKTNEKTLCCPGQKISVEVKSKHERVREGKPRRDARRERWRTESFQNGLGNASRRIKKPCVRMLRKDCARVGLFPQARLFPQAALEAHQPGHAR